MTGIFETKRRDMRMQEEIEACGHSLEVPSSRSRLDGNFNSSSKS